MDPISMVGNVPIRNANVLVTWNIIKAQSVMATYKWAERERKERVGPKHKFRLSSPKLWGRAKSDFLNRVLSYLPNPTIN